MAEGFGRYYPAEFARYLRLANGELAETVESLGDGVDRGHFTNEQIVPIQRLGQTFIESRVPSRRVSGQSGSS
jgi:four helix bundle protein